MNNATWEVDLDHGRVTAKGFGQLPEKARALLTILPDEVASSDPLQPDPALQNVIFHEDPALPLQSEDWPESLT